MANIIEISDAQFQSTIALGITIVDFGLLGAVLAEPKVLYLIL